MREKGAETGYVPKLLTSTPDWIRWKIPSSPKDTWFFFNPGMLGHNSFNRLSLKTPGRFASLLICISSDIPPAKMSPLLFPPRTN